MVLLEELPRALLRDPAWMVRIPKVMYWVLPVADRPFFKIPKLHKRPQLQRVDLMKHSMVHFLKVMYWVHLLDLSLSFILKLRHASGPALRQMAMTKV